MTDHRQEHIKRQTIAALRRGLMLFTPMMLLVLAVASVIHIDRTRTERSILEQAELRTVEAQRLYLLSDIGSVISDLSYTSMLGEMVELFKYPDKLNSDALPMLWRELKLFSQSRKTYDQIRLLDTAGDELARINMVDGRAEIVGQHVLQNKSHRYYFQDSIGLGPDSIYISPFDLNIEQGKVEEPFKPMIRFARPVFDSNGKTRGVIVLNYLGKYLIDRFNQVTGSGKSFSMLVNPQGYWMVGPTRADQWGFMFEEKKDRTFDRKYARAWKTIGSVHDRQFETDAGLFTFSSIHPLKLAKEQIPDIAASADFTTHNNEAKNFHWKVVSLVPHKELYAAKNARLIWILAIVTALALVLGTVCWRLGDASVQRQMANKTMRLLNTELDDRNKELTNLLHVTSHDLRSPLVNVQGFSSQLRGAMDQLNTLLEKHPADPLKDETMKNLTAQVIPQSLNFIDIAAKKMKDLIEGLTRLSKIGRVELNIIDLDMNAMVNEIIATMAYQIHSKDVDVGVAQLPPCRGDADQINQVFSNLIGNALKYLDDSRKGLINISANIEGENAVYCVSDNGIGIAPQHQQKVFDVFWRFDPQGPVPGEGLGLSIVMRILARNNGKIWVSSIQDKGTEFYISLPLAHLDKTSQA